METLRLQPQQLDRAVAIVRAGGVLAFPTDTVYGVGSIDPACLYRVKERPAEKRIAYLVAEWPAGLPAEAQRLAKAFWPGPLTIVSGDNGYRMPDHELALALLRQTGPLPTTSANRSGSGSTADPEEVLRQLGGRIEALLDGGHCPGGRESTVVDVHGSVLREAAVSREAILRVLAG
ncbi:MAG: L-threonylcarbamoyladenylate synthase [Chloroflexota bacterium]